MHWVTQGVREGFRTGDTLFGREQTSHGITVGQSTDGVLTTGDRD